MRRLRFAALTLGMAVAACGTERSDRAAPAGSRPDPTASGLTASGPNGSDPTLSGVGIIAEGCSLVAQLGSGVVIATEGWVVTVAHTIAGASSITVIDGSGTSRAATVRAFDKDADLAVLDVPGLEATPRGLADAVVAGPASFVTWNRDDGVTSGAVEITRRLAITIEDIYVEDTVERSGFEIDGEVEIGDSGGAVVNDGGDVVGIVYANSRQRDRIGFATDITEVAAVLADVGDVGDEVDGGRCV